MKDSRKIRITLGSFDLIKGIAMICIVLGHSTAEYRGYAIFQKSWMRIILNMGYCMIPALLFVSGYGFKEKTPIKILKYTYSKIIKPYLWVMIAIVILYPYVFYFDNLNWLQSVRISIGYTLAYLLGMSWCDFPIMGYEVQWIGAVWYLLASFIAINLVNLILKVKREVYQIILVGISFILGYVLFTKDFNYYCIPHGLIASGYFYLGYLFKKNKLMERCLNCIRTYIILVPIAVAELYWGYFDLNLGDFRYGIVDCIGVGFVGVLFALIYVRLGQIEWRALDWIRNVGIYSYWIFCIHTVDMAFPQWRTLSVKIPNPLISFVTIVSIRVMIIVLGCLGIKRISKRQYQRRIVASGKS